MVVAGEKCKRVNIVHQEIGPFIADPAECNGYDFCGSAEVDGTPNGTYTYFGNWADSAPVGPDALGFWNDAVLETAHGDLMIEERGIVHLGTSDGFAIHSRIVGGTGKYEGATGWMASFGNLEGDFARIAGEICPPEE
jgi:hypothetical protein